MILKLAWRNLLRHKRRSAFIVVGVGVGTLVLLLFKGYIEYAYFGLRLGAIQQYGHVQIAPSGYWDPTAFQKELIPNERLQTLRQVLLALPEVAGYTASLDFGGIIGTPYASTSFVGLGIEPGKAIGAPGVVKGTRLLKGDRDKVLLGKTLAQALGVDIGDYVSVLTTTLEGAVNAGSLQVVGWVSTGQAEADKRIAVVPLSFVQDMLSTSGVEKLLLTLKHTRRTAEFARRLQARLDALGDGLKVKTWDELATLYHQVRRLYDAIFTFASISISLLAFVSILEITTMSFFERLREVGTMMALGTKRLQVFGLILSEGALFGLLGTAWGVLAGQLVATTINAAQLSYTPPGGASPVPLGIAFNGAQALGPLSIVFGATLLSAVVPSLKAARLNIVEVMRHV